MARSNSDGKYVRRQQRDKWRTDRGGRGNREKMIVKNQIDEHNQVIDDDIQEANDMMS